MAHRKFTTAYVREHCIGSDYSGSVTISPPAFAEASILIVWAWRDLACNLLQKLRSNRNFANDSRAAQRPLLGVKRIGADLSVCPLMVHSGHSRPPWPSKIEGSVPMSTPPFLRCDLTA